MAKKRKNTAAETVDPTPEAPPVNGASAEDFKTVLERNQDGVLVVSADKVVTYSNSAGARLLKKKLPKLLGAAFEHDLEDGPMRSIDLHMKVEPIDWGGQPSSLVVLKSLASQQSAFHVEWRIEAAEERAREFEERVKELEAAGTTAAAAAPADTSALEARISDLEADLQSALDRAQDAEQALARAEKRAEQAESENHLAEERARNAEARAKEAESLMEEAEAQALEAERTLEDNGDAVRELEEKYEQAVQRANSLEKELRLAQQGGTDAAELAASSLTEAEERCRTAQAEAQQAQEKLKETQERLTELEELLTVADESAKTAQEAAKTELQELREQFNALQERVDEAEQKVLDAQGRAAEAGELLAAAEEQVAQAQQRADQAESWAAEWRSKLEAAEAQAAELPSREFLHQAREEARAANERAEAAEKRADTAEHRVTELEAKATATAEELSELQGMLEAAEAREAEFLELSKAAEEAGRTGAELQQQLEEARKQAEDLRARLEEAEQSVAAASESQEGLEAAARSASELREQLEAARKEAEEAREQCEAAQNEATEAREQLEAAQNEAKEHVESSAARISELEAALAERPTPEALLEAMERAEAAEGELEMVRTSALEAENRVGLQDGLKQLQETQEAKAAVEEQLAQALKDLGTVRQSLAAAEERAAEAESMLESVELSSGDPGGGAKVAELEKKLKATEERLNQVADEADARVAAALASVGANGEPVVDPETERLAFQDIMTGLPNQNIIKRYLDYTLKQVERYDRTTALLCVDLDRFKVINDALGYKAGDEVLMQVAERLQQVVRDSDVLGRRGEDEFSILLSEVSGGPDPANQVSIVAKRIFEVLAQPFVASGQKVYVGASIGISTSPGDANTAEEMLEHADTAMYRAKELGRGRYQFYTEELQARNESRLRLEAELRNALENKELILLYQPIVQVSTGRMVGVEALMRWHHPEYGLVTPDHFLDAAEETGLIVPMGRWAILQACEQLADWSRKGLDLFVSLNLSTRQFLQADLAATLLRSVEVTGAPVQNVILEIPESIQTLDPSRVEPILVGLRQIGVRLAIDRFGTGFSSLERLHSELASFLKIDRKFILNTPHNSQCVSIAAAAMGLARSLRLRPIAVGVENEAQLTFCRQMDCEMVQGNLIYTAVEPDLVTDLARSGRVIR